MRLDITNAILYGFTNCDRMGNTSVMGYTEDDVIYLKVVLIKLPMLRDGNKPVV